MGGIEIFKISVICFTTQPKANNNITLGIFVFEEVTSKQYAKSNNPQTAIIIDAFMFYFLPNVNYFSKNKMILFIKNKKIT